MRRLSRLMGLLLISSTLALGTSPDKSSPFSIRITTDKSEVKAGSDIFIKIQMTNTSSHTIDCTKVPSNGSDIAYQYDVRDMSGNPALKVPKEHPEIGAPFHVWPCVIKPGESTTLDQNLINREYDMSRPGKYAISVSRFIEGDRKGAGIVKSNVITVSVIP
jgi:hypothetical protein